MITYWFSFREIHRRNRSPYRLFRQHIKYADYYLQCIIDSLFLTGKKAL